ncbi:MAG TPA: flagellar hook-length control protein FliK, partial [Azonexus sp.]|nr:flagellar hook-length control protein FliK [Azonexus sp.]
IVTADGALKAKATDASTVAPQSRQVAMPDNDNAAVDTALAVKATDNNKVSVASTTTPAAAQSSQAATPGSPIPRDLVPIVQQQLDALSTQNYAWQGQIWPGQRMQWEISEDTEGARFSDNDEIVRWQTRLKLSMPMLGGINAVLRLNPAGEVSITVTSDSISSEVRLREGGASLSRQMESAGLNLTQFLVEHGEIAE